MKMVKTFWLFYAFPVEFIDLYKKKWNILLVLRISERCVRFLCNHYKKSYDFMKIGLYINLVFIQGFPLNLRVSPISFRGALRRFSCFSRNFKGFQGVSNKIQVVFMGFHGLSGGFLGVSRSFNQLNVLICILMIDF